MNRQRRGILSGNFFARLKAANTLIILQSTISLVCNDKKLVKSYTIDDQRFGHDKTRCTLTFSSSSLTIPLE